MSNCPLCGTAGQDILWRDGLCRVVLVDDVDYPGFCRVILNRHVREMSDLAEDDRHRLMTVVFAVEAALREVVRPDKVNLASLGNMVPHLHWHVIPRHAGDRHFPDAIWAAPRHSGAPPAAPADLRPRLLVALARRLGPPPI
ncbi:MAG: HIT family protein [Gallionellaceae bacterium]|nr:HIT family protein [Gallionellaceae bacterium]